MLYPVYVHKDDGSAFGATVPDFSGCFSASDTWTDLPKMIQEAIELYCDGEDFSIPAPTPLDRLISNPDFTGGQWIFVDVDINKLSPKAIRLNISLPANLVDQIDRRASEIGMSRSGFLAQAANKELHNHQ